MAASEIIVCPGCDRLLAGRSAFSKHANTCQPSKKRLNDDLGDLRRLMAESEDNKKKQRREVIASLQSEIASSGSSTQAARQAQASSGIDDVVMRVSAIGLFVIINDIYLIFSSRYLRNQRRTMTRRQSHC